MKKLLLVALFVFGLVVVFSSTIGFADEIDPTPFPWGEYYCHPDPIVIHGLLCEYVGTPTPEPFVEPYPSPPILGGSEPSIPGFYNIWNDVSISPTVMKILPWWLTRGK